MPRKRKRRRLIVRRGRGETEEEPFLMSMVCVIFLCPFREKRMRGKSIRCLCSPISTGVLQGKSRDLKIGILLEERHAGAMVSNSRGERWFVQFYATVMTTFPLA